MIHTEWSLVAFTLLGQAAAGLYLGKVLVQEVLLRKAGAAEAVRLTRRPGLIAGLLLALGMLASFLHLGSPMGAFRAANNLATSWLSREILFTLIFGGMWALTEWAERKGVEREHIVTLSRFTAGLGVVMVLVMSMVYKVSIIPAWSSIFTVFTFVATLLVLGGVGVLITLPAEAADAVVKVGPALALAGAAIQVVGLPFYLAGLGNGNSAGRKSLDMLMGNLQPGLWIHMLLVVGLAVVVGLIWHRKQLTPRAVYLALAVGLIGEAAARIIFYASSVPISVG